MLKLFVVLFQPAIKLLSWLFTAKPKRCIVLDGEEVRASVDGVYEVVEAIDLGKVFAIQMFQLKEHKSYGLIINGNEDHAILLSERRCREVIDAYQHYINWKRRS